VILLDFDSVRIVLLGLAFTPSDSPLSQQSFVAAVVKDTAYD
jgi:hypothetical protein